MRAPQWLSILCCSTLLWAASWDRPPVAQEGAPAAGATRIDDGEVRPYYANFFRVTGTPEELVLDFGLNPQPVGTPVPVVRIDNRVVLTFYSAKRLMAGLQQAIQRHEEAFGPVEVDIRKRVLKPT